MTITPASTTRTPSTPAIRVVMFFMIVAAIAIGVGITRLLGTAAPATAENEPVTTTAACTIKILCDTAVNGGGGGNVPTAYTTPTGGTGGATGPVTLR